VIDLEPEGNELMINEDDDIKEKGEEKEKELNKEQNEDNISKTAMISDEDDVIRKKDQENAVSEEEMEEEYIPKQKDVSKIDGVDVFYTQEDEEELLENGEEKKDDDESNENNDYDNDYDDDNDDINEGGIRKDKGVLEKGIGKQKKIDIVRMWLEEDKKDKRKRRSGLKGKTEKKWKGKYPRRYAFYRRIAMAIEKYEDLWDSFNSFLFLLCEKEKENTYYKELKDREEISSQEMMDNMANSDDGMI
jgi:hypothetical protein